MVEKLSQLMDYHLNGFKDPEQNWCIEVSNIAGRGVFALRDIKAGEIVFREPALLLGPTARKTTILNTCTVCYALLPEQDFICKKGCTLPICELCAESKEHSRECSLFRSWKPINPEEVNATGLRALTVARGLFLSKDQKDLLYEMQASVQKADCNEVAKVSKCFHNFPKDRSTIDYFNRIVSVLNTNAFESLNKNGDHEMLLRGLYPLAGIMNHECTPNTSHFFEDNGVIVVKATVDIPERAEITNTYTKLLWSNLMRQFFLKMTKNFQCQCDRCKDPTENGTLLAGLYCRYQKCTGIVIPKDCSIMPQWQCLECGHSFEHSKMSKYQEFALNAINLKMANADMTEMIKFMNDMAPKLCPASNYITVETKLSIIWRMLKNRKSYSAETNGYKLAYCYDILEIIRKLKAGECTLKSLLEEEIEETKNAMKQPSQE